MNPRESRVSAGHRGFAIAMAFVVVAVIVAPLRLQIARADNVDTLIGQLDDDSDRVRLSAALNLAKLGDARAIDPLIVRLVGSDRDRKAADGDKNVRSAAAVGLGSLVTTKVQGKLRDRAVDALTNAEANDSSPAVQAHAGRSLKAIGAGAVVTPTSATGGIYVNIGPMSSKTGTPVDDAKFRAAMVKVATTTMNKVASNMPTTWPGGTAPSKAALAQKSVQGFFVDGTVNEVKTDISGSSATISCKINMLLASYPDKSIFGFLNGGAKVQGSASPRDIALAREDCVAAVVEDLIAKKIVPTITTKTGIAPVRTP